MMEASICCSEIPASYTGTFSSNLKLRLENFCSKTFKLGSKLIAY